MSKNKVCEADRCENYATHIDKSRDVYVCASCLEDMREQTPDGIEAFKMMQAGEPTTTTATTNEFELVIFEEHLTAEGLKSLQEQALLWPLKAKDKVEYDLIYSEHQRLKKIRQLCKKKLTELLKTEKTKFENEKNRINRDYKIVMSVLEPIEMQLSDAREYWDDEIAAHKDNDAMKAAVMQKEEFERQQIIRDEIEAHRENELFDTEKLQEQEAKELEEAAMSVERESEKLAKERAEFEIEKGRLGFDEAWEDAERLEELEACESMTPEMASEEFLLRNNGSDVIRPHTKPQKVAIVGMPSATKQVAMATAAAFATSGHGVHVVETPTELDKEAIKISEEYFAGKRPAVSQEELDKILDCDDDPPPELDPRNFPPSENFPETEEEIAQAQEFQDNLIGDPCQDEDVVTPVNFGIIAGDEADRQPERLKNVTFMLENFLEVARAELETGFESQKLTDNIYWLHRKVDNAYNEFLTLMSLNEDGE